MRIKRKNLKASSKRWLQRQFNDEFVRKAKYEGYRSRSAYKLLEIQEKFALIEPGHTVVDLGCSPGSWTQVAVRSTRCYDPNIKSLVVGLDIKDTEPIDGAVLINGLDFVRNDAYLSVLRALNSRKVNVLLSDMAPNMTGNRFVDHCKVSNLCYAALEVVQRICAKGASLVMKVFDGEECTQIIKDTRKLFEYVKVYHPKATRKASSEMYYIGLRYRGNVLQIPDLFDYIELE